MTFTFARAYGSDLSDDRLRRLNNSEAKGFDYIKLNSPITRKAYEEHCALSTKTTERHLKNFVELNYSSSLFNVMM
jgi:predicted HTH transcriptional regulator